MTLINKYTLTNKACTIALASLGLACAALPARSQETASDRVYDLDAFVTVASRNEMQIQRVGSSVEILEAFDLEKGQDSFILDSIRLVPGFFLRNSGGSGNSFGITTRGLSGNAPMVLVNGIEVSNPNSGRIVNLGNLMTGNVSRVEILKGPQSSLYGANALAGVISIDSLGAGQSSGGRAAFSVGSYDTFEYGIGHSGSQDGFSWSVDANVRESEGFSVQDPTFGPEWADDDAYDSTNVSSIFKYDFNEDTNMYLSMYYVDTRAEFDPGNPSTLWGVPNANNYTENEELYARLGGDFRVAANWTSSLSYDYTTVDYLSHTASDYMSDGDRYKIAWENTVKASEVWTFVAGAEHKSDKISGDKMDNTSVYMENLLQVNEELDVTLGLRRDDHNAYGNETTYRGTFSYRIEGTDARIRGSFGTSFQAPTFLHLRAPWGNPNVKPESGEGWDLGVEKSFSDGRAFASVTLFGNDIDDKIAWSGGGYSNVSQYTSKGVETSFRIQATDAIWLTAAHTYSDARETGGVEALAVPRNVTSLGLFARAMDDKLSVNVNALTVSSQFFYGQNRATTAKLDGYTVVNFAAQYDIDELYSLWLRIGNVFDEDYQEINTYQTAGTNLTAGVRLKF